MVVISFPGDGGLVVVLHCRGPGRAVTIRSRAQEGHRIKLGGEVVLAPETQVGAGTGQAEGTRGLWSMGR